jgi:hypothetical protein
LELDESQIRFYGKTDNFTLLNSEKTTLKLFSISQNIRSPCQQNILLNPVSLPVQIEKKNPKSTWHKEPQTPNSIEFRILFTQNSLNLHNYLIYTILIKFVLTKSENDLRNYAPENISDTVIYPHNFVHTLRDA